MGIRPSVRPAGPSTVPVACGQPMPERLTPADAVARLETRDTLADPARSRSALGVPAGARRARRLGGPADRRRAADRLERGVPASRRPLPLGLLRPARARAARPGREHRLHPGRLPPLRPAAAAAEPARGHDDGHPARRRRLVLALAPRGRDAGRAAPRRRRPRPGAARRDVGPVPAHARAAARAPPRDPRRRDRRPRRGRRRAAAAARPRAQRRRRADRRARGAPTSRTARRCRPASARSPRASPRSSPRATAAATASTPRCSRPGSCTCTRPARSPTDKGLYDGVSVATFALGTEELYAWLDDNPTSPSCPVELVNSPDLIAMTECAVTINGALAVDIHGQVVADTRDADAVLRDRRPRGLRLGPRAVPVRPRAALPAGHVHAAAAS